MLSFSIAQWQGWAAHLPDKRAWQRWAREPQETFCPLHTPMPNERPDCRLDFLPPMQRRRLSPMARQVFACTWSVAAQGSKPPDSAKPCGAAGYTGRPLVFASRHGETTSSFRLLQTLAAHAPLSPTAFCLSVHNALAAQWSIVRLETAESVALSAEDDGLEHAFIEAALLLAAGHDEVLVVVAEERPPAAYDPWITDVPHDYVAAFRLRAGDAWQLALCDGASHDDVGADAPPPRLPNPLNLLRHLLLGTERWRHDNGARCWQWSRGVGL